MPDEPARPTAAVRRRGRRRSASTTSSPSRSGSGRAVGRRRRRLLARGPPAEGGRTRPRPARRGRHDRRPDPAARSTSARASTSTAAARTPSPAATVVFSNRADGRLYRLDPGVGDAGRHHARGPVPLRRPALRRRAGGASSPSARTTAADGSAGGRHRRRRRSTGDATAAGPRRAARTSSPRRARRPTATRLAWLEWDHPDMPWDATRLRVAAVLEDGTLDRSDLAAGGPEESVVQPEWSPDGALHLVSDRSGWWNLYRLVDGPAAGAARARWTPSSPTRPGCSTGRRTRSCPDGSIVAAAARGRSRPPHPHRARRARRRGRDRRSPSSAGCASAAATVVAVAGSPTEAAVLVALDPVTLEPTGVLRRADADWPSTRRRSRAPGVDHLPVDRRARRPTPCSTRRRNPDVTPPDDERPPLVVLSHGGPTANASTALDLDIQLLTSRGIAVVDVDYGGSHRLRPRVPPAARRGVGRRRRRRLRRRRAVPRRARRRRPRAAGHRGRQRRRLHDPRRARLPRRLRGRHQPVRHRRPRDARPRHPQVRVALHGPAGRAVPGHGRSLPPALAGPLPRRGVLPGPRPAGPRGQGRAAQPGRGASSPRSPPTASRTPTSRSRARATASAGEVAQRAAMEAQLGFLGAVFGFEPADDAAARAARHRGVAGASRHRRGHARLTARPATAGPPDVHGATLGPIELVVLAAAHRGRRRCPTSPAGCASPPPILLLLGGVVLGFVLDAASTCRRSSSSRTSSSCCSCRRSCSRPRTSRRSATSGRTAGPSCLLAIGLVLFTTVVVGVVATALIPGLTPGRRPDPRAPSSRRRTRSPPRPSSSASACPRRVVTILEGESLINDASALIAYRVASGVALGLVTLLARRRDGPVRRRRASAASPSASSSASSSRAPCSGRPTRSSRSSSRSSPRSSSYLVGRGARRVRRPGRGHGRADHRTQGGARPSRPTPGCWAWARGRSSSGPSTRSCSCSSGCSCRRSWPACPTYPASDLLRLRPGRQR